MSRATCGPERLLDGPGSSVNGGKSQSNNSSRDRKEKLQLLAMAPYERHKLLVNTYILLHPGDSKLFERDTTRDRTPWDALTEQHRFVWKAKDCENSWEARLAKKYYDRLFREYAICDLSRFETGAIAMRWQTQKEVESGKGQFICAERKCNSSSGLRTWEVPFRYEEQGEKRTELVKLRLCPACSTKLNHTKSAREVSKKGTKKKAKKRKRPVDGSSGSAEEAARKDEEEEKEKARKAEEKEEEEKAEAAAIWSGPAQVPEEETKTREDEFQAYLEDLFF